MKKTMLLIGCIGVLVTTNVTAMFGRFSNLRDVSKLSRLTVQQRKCSEKKDMLGLFNDLFIAIAVRKVSKSIGFAKNEIDIETVYNNISSIEQFEKVKNVLAQETFTIESNKLKVMEAYFKGNINLEHATKLVAEHNDSCSKNRNAIQKIEFVNAELEKENQEWRDKRNKNQKNQE